MSIERKLKHINRTLRIPFSRTGAFKRLEEFHSKPHTLEEVVDSAMDFGTTGYFRVNSMQIRKEIMALANAVAELKPRIVLEIGTASAGTLMIWSNIASEKVITCDLIDPSLREGMYKKFPPPDSHCQVVALGGDSHTEEFRKRVEAELNGEKVDFLFIDGDHTEVGVEADYNDYHHLVRPGGIIAFHDIVEKQPLPQNQVYYFWKRLKDKVTTEEFVHDPDQRGYGIGIVRV